MTLRRKITGLAAALALAVAAPLLATQPAQAAVVEETIGQFNMAGGQEDNADNGLDPADALIDGVNTRRPAAMTLQETCFNWVLHIREKLAEDYEIRINFIQSEFEGGFARCKNGSLFGNALLVRRDLGIDTFQSHRLFSTVDLEQREMFCGTSEVRNLAICTTHLSKDEEVASRLREARVAERILDEDYGSYTRVVGGDLNDQPWRRDERSASDHFYAEGYGLGAKGALKEAMSPCGNVIAQWLLPGLIPCRSGERTTGGSGKIDYLFVEPGLEVTWHDVTDPLHSDHRLVWAKVTGL